MKAYSQDLRERVLPDCDAGLPVRQVATKYRVSESWMRRLRQRRRETGEVLDHLAAHKVVGVREAVDALWHFLGQTLNDFPPRECRHDFRHCGYAAPS